jgi:hypothetical protein
MESSTPPSETVLPLWWPGLPELKLRLGGSFARALRSLDDSAVAAMQGSGDALRCMLTTPDGGTEPELSAVEQHEKMRAAALEAHWVEHGFQESEHVEMQVSMPQFGARAPRLPGERPSRPPGGGTPGREGRGGGSPPHAHAHDVVTDRHVVKLTSSFSAVDDYVLKLLIIGDAGVGKTSILTRFTDDAFGESLGATIGVDLKAKTLLVDG